MKNRPKNPLLAYFFILAGITLIFVEFLLNYYGKSLCAASSCKLVSYLSIIPKNYLLLLGVSYFMLLFLLIKLYLSTEGSLFLTLLLTTLFAGLVSEGIFIARLLLDYKLICYFCLGIGGVFLLTFLSTLQLFSGVSLKASSLMLMGLGIIAGTLMAMKLTTFQAYPLSSSSHKLFLIYAEECNRCKELLSKVKEENLEAIPFNRVYPLLQTLGIHEVPLLIERKEGSFHLYTNPQDIEERLFQESKRVLQDVPCGNQTQGGLCVLP